MKRIGFPLLVVVLVFGAFAASLGFLWWRAQTPTVTWEVATASRGDLVQKTVATGAIVPRNEVAIKSRVSGVVAELFVEPGALVASGDPLLDVRIQPDSVSLNNARSAVASARIAMDAARRDKERVEVLAGSAAISDAEVQRARTAFELAQQDHRTAQRNLQIIEDGAASGLGDVSTRVRSTVAGMVLAVDVDEGQSVIERNTFNEGTTVAHVADMTDLVFEGSLDESEVGRVAEGMPVAITVGALADQRFTGTLEYISPKGLVVDGAVQFEIRAAVQLPGDTFVRAGSSANADIVLDRREDVLVLEERLLHFEGDRAFVFVEDGQGWAEQDVAVGLSDGLRIEVLSGIDETTRLRGRQR